MRRPLTATIGIYAAVVVVALFSAFPILWMVATSFKNNSEIFSRVPDLIPNNPSLERYGAVLSSGFGRYMLNSLIVAAITMIAGLLVASFAGYALARFRFPMRRYLMIMTLSIQMFPAVALIIPLFTTMRTLGLLDTYASLVLAYLTFTVPLAVWMLKGFFQSTPRELEEAAMIDGATTAGAFFRIALPLAAPGLAATAIFSFIAAWNEFLFALTFIKDDAMRTLPVALQTFIGRAQADWGMIMAGSVLFTLPIVAFFLIVHRRLVQGMAGGALR